MSLLQKAIAYRLKKVEDDSPNLQQRGLLYRALKYKENIIENKTADNEVIPTFIKPREPDTDDEPEKRDLKEQPDTTVNKIESTQDDENSTLSSDILQTGEDFINELDPLHADTGSPVENLETVIDDEEYTEDLEIVEDQLNPEESIDDKIITESSEDTNTILESETINEIGHTEEIETIEEIEHIEDAESIDDIEELKYKLDDETYDQKNLNAISKDSINFIEDISIKFSMLSLNKDTSEDLFKILCQSLHIQKAALCFYNTDENSYRVWKALNLSEASIKKFNLEFDENDEKFSRLMEGYAYYSTSKIEFLKQYLSIDDFSEIEFILIVPFIFAGRLIGLFICLKTISTVLNEFDIRNLEIIGRLNGPFFYNIIQVKKNDEEKPISGFDKLRLMAERFVSERKSPVFGVIGIRITGLNNFAKIFPEFDADLVLSDIHFIIISETGSDGYVYYLEPDVFYVFIPNIIKSEIIMLEKKITGAIQLALNEIIDDLKNIQILSKNSIYPQDNNTLDSLFSYLMY